MKTHLPLTERETRVLKFILDYRKKYKVSPTEKEIAGRLRCNRSLGHYYVEQLVLKGKIVREPKNYARNIVVL